jgi:hypothetical protein
MRENIERHESNGNIKKIEFFSLPKLLLLGLVLVLSLACILFLFFNRSADVPSVNTIKTKNGSVSFSYNEGNNAISLSQVYPIKDTTGIKMIGNGEYFDFNIKGSVKNGEINYQIVASQDGKSVITSSYIKVYLTEINNGQEEVIVGPILLSNLVKYLDDNQWIILTKRVADNFDTKYRFRMWVDEKAILYDNTGDETIDITGATFGIKLNVYASQI